MVSATEGGFRESRTRSWPPWMKSTGTLRRNLRPQGPSPGPSNSGGRDWRPSRPTSEPGISRPANPSPWPRLPVGRKPAMDWSWWHGWMQFNKKNS